MQWDGINELLSTITEQTGSPCVLAGGAVRDHLLFRSPRDYDIFLLSDTVHTPDLGLTAISDDEDVPTYADSIADFTILCQYRSPSGIPIQVIRHNSLNSVDALLDYFDWNVCQFAFGVEMGVVKRMNENSIARGTLRLSNLDRASESPLTTLRRGFRFVERYKMTMYREDLLLLCESIMELSNV